MQVYTVDLAGMNTAPTPWLTVLDDTEIQRAGRFCRPQDRLTFVAAHALKRLALAQALSCRNPEPVRPGALRFAADPYGKPFLADGGAVQFNISHTSALVALALSFRGPIGIDVEALGSTVVSRDTMACVLSRIERAQLDAADDWTHAFLRLWTAKEAVAKAEGKGLSLSLDEIAVLGGRAQGPSRLWSLWRSCPTPHHVLSLAFDETDDAPDNCPLRADDLTAWVRDGKIPPR